MARQLLESTVAVELRVDTRAVGFSSSTGSVGPESPGTLVDDAGTGTVAWSNPGNAASSDDTYATATLAGGASSHYLKATNYGISLPASTIVTGIEVKLEISEASAAETVQFAVLAALVKGGSIQTGAGQVQSTTTNSTTDVIRILGGPGDLWNNTWLDTDIESATWGVAVFATSFGGSTDTVRVDRVHASIYYTVSGQEVEVTGAPAIRFSPDEADAGSVPLSFGFDTEIPGGFSAANCTVSKPDEFTDFLPYLYGDFRAYEYETNDTLAEGRVVGISDDGEQVSLEVEGWAKHLEDDKTAREIFYDRDLSRWEGLSVQHRLNQISGTNWAVNDATLAADDTTGAPALVTGFELTSAQWATTEGWYDAQGLVIAAVDYAWKKGSRIDNADTDWTWRVIAATTDTVASADVTASLRAAGPGSGTLTTTGGNKKFAAVQLWLTDTTHTQGFNYEIYWTLLSIIGNHGLTLRGAVSAPNTGRGIYVSDLIEHVVETWAPLLTVTESESMTFAVPHLTFPEPTTAMAMLEAISLFGTDENQLVDWWVYEDKGFGYATPGEHGKTWRTRYDEGAEASNSGPDAQRLLNGIYLTYDDGTGSKHSVGPPDSDADFETADLIDLSDSNPANRDGANHWELFDAGVTTQTGAVQIGRVILAERNRMEWRGSVKIVGEVRDDAGNWHPAAKVRAGDFLVVEDDPDTRPRRIVNTSYSLDSEEVQCSIGARPDRLDVLLARNNVVLQGKLS